MRNVKSLDLEHTNARVSLVMKAKVVVVNVWKPTLVNQVLVKAITRLV
jgi:hypothetical protein